MQKALVQPIHTAVNGRARFEVGGLYGSEAMGKHLESRLSNHNRIHGVSVNVLTGNVLILYNSSGTHHTVAALIEGFVIEYKKKNGNHRFGFRDRKKRKEQFWTPGKKRSASGTPDVRRVKHLRKYTAGNTEDQIIKPWHLMDVDAVLNHFMTEKDLGLSLDVADMRFKRYGPNVLPETPPRSWLSIVLEQFKSLPVLILLLAAGISVFTGGVADALVILSVVAINATIGCITENQAERIINSLKKLIKPSSRVIRNGIAKDIRAEEIVTGDILVLRAGVYITADCRVIDTTLLTVDESALTGESLPVMKAPASLTIDIPRKDIPIGDRINMVYAGTIVTGGQGYATAVATGRFTEIGKIQTLVGEAKPPDTPLEKQLNKMGGQLVAIGGGVCGIVFLIGLLRGYGMLEMLKTSISLAVAAIPEGLPTVATTTLTLGIMNMRKRNVIIRHLDAVESLGAMQTICLDKTGTITMNRMTVVDIYAGTNRLKVADGKFLNGDEPVNPHTCKEILKLIHVTVLCNETEVSIQNGEYQLKGSPTESAFITLAINSGVDIISLRNNCPLLKINHRAENRNFMVTVHQSQKFRKFVALKGSPAEVLAMCARQMKDGKTVPITEEYRDSITTENERMAGDALRVLGAAYQHAEDGEEPDLETGFIWIGLIGMADPVRKGVDKLIDEFHAAGIETIMITGDQMPTAYAIGKELDLSGGSELKILESTHLTNIEPEVLKGLCENIHVFARVSPAHKLQIVQALQRAGKVVAMTGDGINDGPALKAADIGIAMGHSGTDVAREVADIVLEDDNLETMIAAVSHGRTIYRNIRKSLHFLLSTNMSETIVTFGAIAGGIGQPLNAMQLLWINLISDIFPAIALSLEPPEPDVMKKPPRNPNEPIIRKSDFKKITIEASVISASALGAYLYGIMRYGMGPKASTVSFMSLTVAQLLHAISSRSETHNVFDTFRNRPALPPNRYLNMAIGGSLILQVLTLAVPGLRNILKITPIGVLDGLVVGGSAVLPFLINESAKKGGGKGAIL